MNSITRLLFLSALLLSACGSSNEAPTEAPVIFGAHEPPFVTIGTPGYFVVTATEKPIASVQWIVGVPIGKRADSQIDGIHLSVTPLDPGCYSVSAIVGFEDGEQVTTEVSASCVTQ